MTTQNNKFVDPKDFESPLCAKANPILFYVDDEDEDVKPEFSNKSYDDGIKICRQCTHASDCAEWGIRNEKWGLWGGLTPQERVKIRRRRRINLRDSK